MENFLKPLDAISELPALQTEAEGRSDNLERQRREPSHSMSARSVHSSFDEGFEEGRYGELVPRPSASVAAAERITEQLARHPSVSSGYASSSSSMNSSRRNSDPDVDETMHENRVVARQLARPANPPANPANPPANLANPWLDVLAIGVVGLTAVGAFYACKSLSKKNVLIETFPVAEAVLKEIKNDAKQYPVVGLDCQWVSYGRNRSNVALLQLYSHNGHTALIQLNKIGRIPNDLRDLLANRNITKAGIETLQDAIYLEQDYGLVVHGTFDLRYMARDTGHQVGGLKRLAKDILSVDIGQEVEIMASDWEQDPLDAEQVDYAEAAVKASFKIFEKLVGEKYWIAPIERAQEYVKPMLDKKFR